MAKTKEILNKTTYSTAEILEAAKIIFHIESKKYDSRSIRQIQRYVNKKNFSNYSNNNKGSYSKKDVQKLLYDDEMIKYFGKFGNKNLNYQTNDELIYEEQVELKEREDYILEQQKKAGLTCDEATYLVFDLANEHKYLQIDELIALQKTGLVLKSNLSDEEKYILELYNKNREEFEYQEKQIEEIFNRKKLEIMITALFDREFIFDESKLKEDISNYVRSGKFSCGTNNPKIRRSFLRLQNPKEYFHKKKNK